MRAVRPTRFGALIAAVGMTLALVACSGGDPTSSPGTTDTTAAPETTTTTEVPLEAGTQVSVYNPTVGDCIDRRQLVDSTTKRTSTITLLLDCALPHSYEVFGVINYPEPTTSTLPSGGTVAPNGYPGEDVVRRFAKLECAKAFEPYVGAPYETSQIEMGYLLPTSDNWTRNRTVICWLRTTGDDDKLVGSKRGSGE